MTTEYAISIKRSKGERLYLKTFRMGRGKDAWTDKKKERFTTTKWEEIEDIYNELLDRIHRYEQRQTVTKSELADYLNGQNGTLEILVSTDRVEVRRSISMKTTPR